jgi:hypothetical protein
MPNQLEKERVGMKASWSLSGNRGYSESHEETAGSRPLHIAEYFEALIVGPIC